MEQDEHILEHIPVGVAVLDCADLRFRYVNPYLLSLIEESWQTQGVIGYRLEEIVPSEVHKVALPILHQVCSTGQSVTIPDIPYEGLLKARGRTYWRVEIKPSTNVMSGPSPADAYIPGAEADSASTLLIIVEDQTSLVRQRLHLKAFHNISSAIAGPYALPLVLDRILQAVQEMVGSTRCAIMLIEQPELSAESLLPNSEKRVRTGGSDSAETTPIIRVAAQKGVHLLSHDWHPRLNKRLLVDRVMRDHRTFIITDTATEPELELPLLDDAAVPRRPGSVLCVPIFEPASEGNGFTYAAGTVLGTIEVYHRRARGFPAEEVELLEQFAQQAGLAIQNARLFRDINRLSALQAAKAAQEIESARLQLLLERLPSGVMVVSAADKRITIINNLGASLLRRMGWAPALNGSAAGTALSIDDHNVLAQLAVGLKIEELLHDITTFGASGAVVPYEQHPLFLALCNGEAREAELHIIQPDGQTLFLLVNAAPLRAPDGTITDAVSVWHDITHIKALERAREDFFTTMAHELKTPLANIRAHLSALLARDLQWSAREQQDFVEAADEQVERLVGMINHFLDASRVEAGALRLELEPVLLPELLEDLQDRLEALIASSQRKLEIRVPADLPAVRADYELIMNVLTNLLSNAFHYAPEGDTVLLAAELVPAGADQQPAGVELRVMDRGPGITQEQQALLFTRFSTFAAMRRPAADRPGQPAIERRRGATRWAPASGLGLYISRGIIEAHGSKLTLKSSPGAGATFAFVLPIAINTESEVR